ncbi:MAG TPA: N-acetylmuramoyl-L-alanine amidase [Castellaniella sp.]|nr:N-acetylmuramoyl-L-alanine amidase [Castellaniella sp.]
MQPLPAVAPRVAVPVSKPLTVPLIVLDPGHNPADGGAISIHGTQEIGYNDRFVAELAPALRKAGWRVELTRSPDESVSLLDRAQVASDLRATLFLSVHHDSVRLRCLKLVTREGRAAYETLRPMGGYSLYVSEESPEFAQSYRFARLLAEQLRALGRPPLLEHAGADCGEHRPLLDPWLGIYRYDHLAVLRHNEVPAVLLEVGVITDAHDESYVGDPANRKKMIGGIVQGIRAWLAQNRTPNG